MTIRVTYEDTETGAKETAELPSDNFMVICCRATDAVEEIAGYLSSQNGIMRLWKATELAEQAVDALIEASPGLIMSGSATHGARD